VTDGATLFERNPDVPLIVASNQKLATTAAALARLGPDAELRTELLRTGKLAAGVVHGHLVLRGGGDPSPGARFDGDADGLCRRFARILKERGVRRIEGDVVADDRLFDREGVHPEWPKDQLDRWYCAPTSALTLNDGCVDVSVAPGPRAGEPAVVKLAPPCSLVELDVRCTTTADRKAHTIAVDRKPGTNRIVVRGAILASAEPFEVSIALHDPALTFAATLRDRLLEEDIEVTGRARLVAEGEDLSAARPLAAHVSRLSTLLPVINKRSQNHHAEQVLKLVGARAGKGGTYAAGAEAVGAFLRESGIAPEAFVIRDGSGLARGNRLSPRGVVRLLTHMLRHEHRDEWLASLPVSGREGTLRNRMKEAPLAGMVLAKTGTISGVSALSGYILDAVTGEPAIAFSILMNSLRGGADRARDIQDLALGALIGR
jgi:D-alanyl-D-alanine carboxypeptidase/D-alanyl-D-alanine-endopeptidase (penicillin-binding protein 4)